MSVVFSGHCLCGRVSLAADGPPLWVAHCHCESCRRACSAPFTTFFAIPNGKWRWTGAEPKEFRSSPRVRRFFCGACGSPMAYWWDGAPDETHFFAATLEDPAAVTPTSHDFHEERLPWIHLSDGLPTASGAER